MKYAYPVIVTRQPDGCYLSEAPDLPGVVCGGESLADALINASAGCEMWLADAEANREPIPAPSDPSAIAAEAGAIVSMVAADTDDYRRKNDTRAVKKTLSIPAWMAEQADANGVSLSQVLQEALRQRFDRPSARV